MLWCAYKDAYLEWLSLHGGERNVAKARDILGRFTIYVDPYTLEQLDNGAYTRYLVRRRQDVGRCGALAAATINGDIRYLNAAFAAALRPDSEHPDRLGLADPGWQAPRMKLLREPRRRPRCVTQDALSRAFAACDRACVSLIPGCPAPLSWIAFYLLGYMTGIRCGGLLLLPRPSEDDLRHALIRMPADFDKADGERAFYLTDEAVALIRRLPPAPGGKLFHWPHGRRYFYTVLHGFMDRAGIPRCEHVLPHDLRRTKGTELVNLGCPLPLVQRELGHASPAVTERYYVGQISDAQRQAIRSLPLPATVRRKVRDCAQEQLCLFH